MGVGVSIKVLKSFVSSNLKRKQEGTVCWQICQKNTSTCRLMASNIGSKQKSNLPSNLSNEKDTCLKNIFITASITDSKTSYISYKSHFHVNVLCESGLFQVSAVADIRASMSCMALDVLRRVSAMQSSFTASCVTSSSESHSTTVDFCFSLPSKGVLSSKTGHRMLKSIIFAAGQCICTH